MYNTCYCYKCHGTVTKDFTLVCNDLYQWTYNNLAAHFLLAVRLYKDNKKQCLFKCFEVVTNGIRTIIKLKTGNSFDMAYHLGVYITLDEFASFGPGSYRSSEN